MRLKCTWLFTTIRLFVLCASLIRLQIIYNNQKRTESPYLSLLPHSAFSLSFYVLVFAAHIWTSTPMLFSVYVHNDSDECACAHKLIEQLCLRMAHAFTPAFVIRLDGAGAVVASSSLTQINTNICILVYGAMSQCVRSAFISTFVRNKIRRIRQIGEWKMSQRITWCVSGLCRLYSKCIRGMRI